MLYELIYSSRAAPSVTKQTLDDILDICRKNNVKNDITGLLIFDGSTFCQVLEGEKSALETLYASIEQDERHIDSSILHFGEIGARNFAEWSMSYKRVAQKIEPDNWTDWLTAQEKIASITGKNTLGAFLSNLYDVRSSSETGILGVN